MIDYSSWPVPSKPWTLLEIILVVVLVVALAALGLLFRPGAADGRGGKPEDNDWRGL